MRKMVSLPGLAGYLITEEEAERRAEAQRLNAAARRRYLAELEAEREAKRKAAEAEALEALEAEVERRLPASADLLPEAERQALCATIRRQIILEEIGRDEEALARLTYYRM
jgi:ABC-type uncharacterized transport system ATPase component